MNHTEALQAAAEAIGRFVNDPNTTVAMMRWYDPHSEVAVRAYLEARAESTNCLRPDCTTSHRATLSSMLADFGDTP